MNEQYDGWIKASHRSVAVCNDCHVPHDFVGKYSTKAKNGFWHSFYFTTRTFHEPIRATPSSRKVTEASCRNCHEATVAGDGHARARRARTRSPASAVTARSDTWSCRRHPSARNRGEAWLTRRSEPAAAPPPPSWRSAFSPPSPRRRSSRLLVNIFERKQEAKNPFFRVVELTDETDDPAVWGKNFPLQYDGYLRTVGPGAHALRRQRGAAAHADRGRPALRRRAGAPRRGPAPQDDVGRLRLRRSTSAKKRGHAYMLDDQTLHRARQRVQAARHLPPLPRLGLRPLQESSAAATSSTGFETMNQMPYAEARKLRRRTPVACIDCHDPETMALRVTRPGFLEGIRRSRRARASQDYDVNTMATRQEMRTLRLRPVPRRVLLQGRRRSGSPIPWAQGPEGRADRSPTTTRSGFKDWTHAETGAPALKAQHPEFEMWNQGIHARSGVACADCHMPYTRVGALEDQRPPRAQPAAQHQQRLPDLPPVARGGAAGARRDDPGPHRASCATAPWTRSWP